MHWNPREPSQQYQHSSFTQFIHITCYWYLLFSILPLHSLSLLHSLGAGGCGTWSSQGEHQEVKCTSALPGYPWLCLTQEMLLPITRWRTLVFLLLRWIRPDVKRPDFHCYFFFLGLSWKNLALGRCFWRDGGWKLSEISGSSRAAALWILESSRGRGIPRAAWTHFASWAALGTSATASNSHVTVLSH